MQLLAFVGHPQGPLDLEWHTYPGTLRKWLAEHYRASALRLTDADFPSEYVLCAAEFGCVVQKLDFRNLLGNLIRYLQELDRYLAKIPGNHTVFTVHAKGMLRQILDGVSTARGIRWEVLNRSHAVTWVDLVEVVTAPAPLTAEERYGMDELQLADILGTPPAATPPDMLRYANLHAIWNNITCPPTTQ